MRAGSLAQALNILDPEHSLRTDEELASYYVERPDGPLLDLALLLKSSDKPQKILFTGHRGSGKTTELARLSQELRSEFRILSYSVKDRMNLFDLTYVDVILSLGLELINHAVQVEVPIEQDVLREVLDFAKDISRDVEIGGKVGGDVGVELNFLVGKLTTKLSAEDATREVVREKVRHRLSDLLENIRILTEQIETRTKQRLLTIVEDIDKADLDVAKQLFYGHATSLQDPAVSVIYTFPIALRHDNNFPQIRQNFTEVYVLPNLKTRHKDGSSDQTGRDKLKDLFTRRVETTLADEGALGALVQWSSGIPRELVALGRRSCLEAMKAKAPVIDQAAVERAARNRRIDYEVLLTPVQIDLLKTIRGTKRIHNDDAHRALLHNLSVLEYRNDMVWYDVHRWWSLSWPKE